jgi:predicted phage terminase large subunit-like protein
MAKRREIGSIAYAQEFLNDPSKREGRLFEREWFAIVEKAPVHARRVRYWDLASTAPGPGNRDPDWTVGARVAEKDGAYWIEDIRRTRTTPAGVEALVRQTAEMDGKGITVYMEQEPGSSGKNTIDHYARRVLKGFAFYGHRTSGSKEVRANPVSAAAEAGNIYLVRGPWINDFLEEAEQFPGGAHDDQIDAVSGALEILSSRMNKVSIDYL